MWSSAVLSEKLTVCRPCILVKLVSYHGRRDGGHTLNAFTISACFPKSADDVFTTDVGAWTGALFFPCVTSGGLGLVVDGPVVSMSTSSGNVVSSSGVPSSFSNRKLKRFVCNECLPCHASRSEIAIDYRTYSTRVDDEYGREKEQRHEPPYSMISPRVSDGP